MAQTTLTNASPDGRLPAARLGSPRMVGRQRPGRHRLAHLGLRLRGGGLRRPRDRRVRPGLVRAGPGRRPLRRHRRTRPRQRGDPARAAPRRRHPPPGLAGRRRRRRRRRWPRPGGRRWSPSPPGVEGDAGSVTTAAIADLRRDPPPLRRARPAGTGVWGPGFTAERLPPRPAGDRGRADGPSTTWSATSRRADSTTGSNWYREVLGLRGDATLRRRPDLDPVLGAALDGACTTAPASSCPSTSPPPA